MSGILCSGNIVVDLLVRPVDEIRWGASIWVDDVHRSLGGNGANTAYSAAMQGTAVRLLGSVGADEPDLTARVLAPVVAGLARRAGDLRACEMRG